VCLLQEFFVRKIHYLITDFIVQMPLKVSFSLAVDILFYIKVCLYFCMF